MNFLALKIAVGLIVLAIMAFMAEPTVPTPQDAQLLLEDTTTKTASYSSTGKDLGAGFAPAGIGQPMAAIIQVTAADRADSNETYTFVMQQAPDNASWVSNGPAVAVAVNGAVATLGTLVVPGFVTQRYVRIALTIAGTTPSITFKAWLNPRPLM